MPTPDELKDLDAMKSKVLSQQTDLEDTEDEMYAAATPKGRFTNKVVNTLVDATNKLLPLFGITDLYDKFTEPQLTTLPPEFARLLTMFSKAIEDAIEAGVLPEDATIDLAVVTDDAGIQGLAGRIGMAAKSAQFKRFLSKKVKERGAEEMGKEGEYSESETPSTESTESTDTLFAGRM